MALGNIDLTPQLVQAVRDTVDIVDIASEHTRLTKAGNRHKGLCPLHKEKTPSFSVEPSQGLFYCFGCGVGGDAIKLHMLLTGDDFPAAIEALARRYGIPLPSRSGRRRKDDGPDLEGALAAAAEHFRDHLRRHPEPREYLRRRRIPEELIERFGVGYAPDDWDLLWQTLSPKIPLKDLEAAGLVGRRQSDGKPYDRFRHRLIFPIHSPSGRLVGFGGRALGDDKAKYINTAETERFHKSHLLYGLHQAKRALRDTGRALLVEGYFDVLGAAAAGLDAVVASMGTSLTERQAKMLSRFVDEVVVGYDGDDAGETAYRRALPILLGQGLGVYRARFGEGHDPDSLRLEQGEGAVTAAVETAEDGVLAEIGRLVPPELHRHPRRQAEAARQVVELLRPVPDAVARFAYARLAAERLQVPVEMIARRLTGRPSRSDPSGPPEGVEGADGPARATGRSESGSGPRSTGEQAILELLLAEGAKIPPPDELPPPEAFLDPKCRNIYRLFYDLYGGEGTEPPDARALLANSGEPAMIDAMAEIMVGGTVVQRNVGLPELLQRRWRQQRLKELHHEINEAQRADDVGRLQELLEEKTALSRRHHPVR
jgi:DNA primase catalytic core